LNNYIREHGFEEELELNMVPNIASNASTTYDPKTGKHRLNIKVPCAYRKDWILGVADHEAATHFLRRHNEKFQPWLKKREKYEIKSCLVTEEGLAGLNQFVRTVSWVSHTANMYRRLTAAKVRCCFITQSSTTLPAWRRR
jgi:hypothetical protein